MANLRLAIVQSATERDSGTITELRQFLPDSDCFVIGRGPTADFCPALAGRLISLHHATVIKRPEGGWLVFDGLVNPDGDRLGPTSTNGLFVNGRPTNGQAALLARSGDTVSLVSPQVVGLTVAVIAVDSIVKAAITQAAIAELDEPDEQASKPYEDTLTPAEYAPSEQRSDIAEIKAELASIKAKVDSLATTVCSVESVNAEQDMGLKVVRRVSVILGCLLVISLIAAAADPAKRERLVDTAVGLAVSATLAGAGLMVADGKLVSGKLDPGKLIKPKDED
jgi:pSer/pThr/pTyr-binding forkhead associated (FHA) protein